MTKPILFIVPYGAMTRERMTAYSRQYPNIAFDSVDPLRPLDKFRRTLRKSTEIVAARGSTAQEIKRAYPNLHVVDIPITAYDVIRAINAADHYGKTVAVITSYTDIIGLDVLAMPYNIRIRNHLLTSVEKLHETISKAMDMGADMIMGGALTRKVAMDMNVPVVYLPFGPESMQQVLKEVQHIQTAIETEAVEKNFVNRLLDNIIEGVVAVDARNAIRSVNAAARHILGLSGRALLGESLEALAPTFSPQTGKNQAEELASIRGNMVMLNRIPVMYRNRCLGTIFTLHEGRKIETMEKIIRRKMYTKPHTVRYTFADVMGKSPAIRRAIENGKSYARTESSILITGESGCGKEIFAQSIHHESARREHPFVAVNCAALSKDLLQSELFGYVEGAFTGALRQGKMGLFEFAHRGTIFLDEIAEMDYANQGNLLRVIQERYVIRLGSHNPVFVNVRVIAATNKNLTQLVREGKFRNDLYYRLNVLALEIPPLRERKQDIASLLLHFLHEHPSAYRGRFVLREDAEEALSRYSWPGNVRELSNIAERLAATAKGCEITRQQLSASMHLPDAPAPGIYRERLDAINHKKDLQLQEIKQAIAACDGNLGQAARELNINRTTLWRRIRRLP
ncbi:MAG: sigma 54-interacting transcriptional regulator [Desulfovibrio sp.]|nr:sigma 54-interacting transcriptional regulator [Desulfovibrio sp.]